MWTFLLYPSSLIFLQTISEWQLISHLLILTEVQFSPSEVPPLCLPFSGVTWRLLKHFLLRSRALRELWGSTGLSPILPLPLANHLLPLSKTPFHFGLCLLFIPPSNLVLVVIQLRLLLICWGFWHLNHSLPSHAMILGDFTIYLDDKFNTLVSKLLALLILQLPAGPNQYHLCNL